jgi:transcriptional regulator
MAIAAVAIDRRSGELVHSVIVADETESLSRLVAALHEMERAAADNIERSREIQRRAHLLRRRLEAGGSLVELVRAEAPPRTVELVSSNMTTLETAGAELRAAQALALRAEGLTIESIADLFGVSRQRISALLRQRTALES